MPVPGGTFLIAMGRTDRAVHVQHDVLQPVAVVEPVDPLPVQIGQRRPVLRHGQRLGLEPPHLRGRGCLRIDGTATDDLAHDGIKSQSVGVVDVLVARKPTIDRLTEQTVKTMEGVLATAAIIERTRRKIRQPEHVIQLAHHQKAAVGTELRATKFQPHPAVKTKPPITRFACTLRVIHEARPLLGSTS